jgi:hypothetical protein
MRRMVDEQYESTIPPLALGEAVDLWMVGVAPDQFTNRGIALAIIKAVGAAGFEETEVGDATRRRHRMLAAVMPSAGGRPAAVGLPTRAGAIKPRATGCSTELQRVVTLSSK